MSSTIDDFVEVTEEVTVVMCEECNDILWMTEFELDEDEDAEDHFYNFVNEKVVIAHSARGISKEIYELDWHRDYYVVKCFCCENNVEETMDGFFVTIDTYGVIAKDDTYGGCVIQHTEFDSDDCDCEACI